MILLLVVTSSSVRRAGVIAAFPVEKPVKESWVQVWLKMWWPSLHVAGVGCGPLPRDTKACFDVVGAQEVQDGSGIAQVGTSVEGVRHHPAAGVAPADGRSRRSLQHGVTGVHPTDDASVAGLEPVSRGCGHGKKRAVRHLPECGAGCGCTGPQG